MLDLAIVIVNFNSKDDLRKCLDSVFEASRGELKIRVCVVDNSSTDCSGNMVASMFPQVNLIRRPDNPGFATSNNAVLQSTRARYYLVLNPDVVVMPGSIEEMVAYLDRNPDTGIAGCKLINSDGSLQDSCRRYPDIITIALRAIGAGKLFPNLPRLRRYLMKDWNHSEIADVDWIFGSCMVIRYEALCDTGLFDEKFFMYYEDVDLCYRMWQGWKVTYLPDISMIHHHRQLSHRIGQIRLRLIHLKSAIYFFRKHGYFANRLETEPHRLVQQR
jgi:GT2 family glycosyltransferase